MTTWRAPALLRPKNPLWMRRTLLIAALSVLIFAGAAWFWPWRPGRLGGLVTGTAAALLFVNGGLYPLRRRLRAWPLATAMRWLQLHVYGSSLAMLFVLLHTGLGWPAGQMGWWLLGLSSWTTATGYLGVILQKRLPVLMARTLAVEAIYERIPELVARLRDEADRIMDGATGVIADVYRAGLEAWLAAPQPSWHHLLDASGVRRRVLADLDRAAPYLDAADQRRAGELRSVVADKLDLDAQASYQRALRLWLVTHVPAAMLLLGVLAVHIIAVLYL